MSITLRPEFPSPPAQPTQGGAATSSTPNRGDRRDGVATYNEADLIRPDLTIDDIKLHRLAIYRAEREQLVYADIGVPRSLNVLVREERRRLRETVLAMIACRRAFRDVQELTPHERLIRSLELKVEKLRHGLGMPRDQDALAFYERQLAQARTAEPTDPAVLLAAKLEASQ